jgi:hypothetical protein
MDRLRQIATAMRSRAFGIVVSVVLLGATLQPLVRQPTDDGFPLSTYPMFAFTRPTKLTMSYAIGETADRTRHYLAPGIIGSTEVLQARAILQHAVARGGAELASLCARIAARVGEHAEHADITTIRILTGTHDAVEFLVRDTLGREVERTRCPVPR